MHSLSIRAQKTCITTTTTNVFMQIQNTDIKSSFHMNIEMENATLPITLLDDRQHNITFAILPNIFRKM